MLKGLLSCGLLVMALSSGPVQAADRSQGNLIVNAVIPEGNGVLVGFTVRPTDCATAYKGAHAYLATGVKNFDVLYALVSTAQITGQAVTISYVDNGDCSSLAQLLSLSNVSQ